MEEVIKTIKTKKGGKVSLIKPDNGRPFFRYLAGAVATTDSFRYVIRQHGQEDTAMVNIQVKLPQTSENDDQKNFNNALKGFLSCADAFMDGTKSTMALTNLLGIDEGDVLNDDWLEKVFSSFRFIDYAKESEALEFEQHYGQYHYVREEGYWKFEPGGTSAVLHFPSSAKSQENDAEWVIDYIKTIPTKTENDFYHLPVAVSTQLSIRGEKLLGFKINEMSYLEGTAIPLFADIEAVAWPYVLKLNLESQDQKEFALRASINDEKGGCHLDVDTVWHVNQDLRDKLQDEHIHLVHGHINLNEIAFTNLNTLWEAAKSNIDNQEELDKVVKIECLLKGKKIGDVRYIIKEEAVELTYLDGTRQNISDIVVEHFKQYFKEPKPTGEVRNNAFNMSAHTSFRASATPITTIADTRKKTTDNLAQAVRRRTIRKGDLSKIGREIARLFRVEEITPYYPYPGDSFVHTPYLPDSLTTTPDVRPVTPDPKPDLINPTIIKPKTPLVTPEDRPELTVKPGSRKTPTVKPPKTEVTPTIKPSVTPTPDKTATIKPKAGTIKPKTTGTIKPATPAVKPTTTAKPSSATVKPKTTTVEKASATTAKPKTVKAPATIKPVTAAKKTTAKPTTIKKPNKPNKPNKPK